MRARALPIVGGFVVAAIVLALAATSPAPELVSGPPQLPGFEVNDRTDTPPRLPKVAEGLRPGETDRDPPLVVTILTTVLLIVVLVALLGLAAAGAIAAWQRRPRVVLRRPRPDWDDVEVHDAPLDAAADRIRADAAAQEAALATGAARNGIVECWLRLESAIADVGTPSRPSDTSAEVVERVLSVHAVDPDAIEQLSSLYREARFSTHPMGAAERASAVRALGAVHASLRAGAATRSATMNEAARGADATRLA